MESTGLGVASEREDSLYDSARGLSSVPHSHDDRTPTLFAYLGREASWHGKRKLVSPAVSRNSKRGRTRKCNQSSALLLLNDVYMRMLAPSNKGKTPLRTMLGFLDRSGQRKSWPDVVLSES
jgi:hypothetical protein